MYGFFIVMGEFGAGKTQNTTKYLKKYHPKNEINISNYYTGYSQFELSSVNDIINIFNDIYDYHKFVNYEASGFLDKLFKLKPTKLRDDYIIKKKEFDEKYGKNLIPGIKFNITLDEASIYFNPRNFKTNFSGDKEDLLNFIFQLRKLNTLFFCVVQSPHELDVRFRRLATYYRKYYTGMGFYRWYKDFYFYNPEDIDFEKAEQVGGGVLRGGSFNFYPYYPKYDYFTYELIKPGVDIYKKGDLLKYISALSKMQIKPGDSLPIIRNFKFSFQEENKDFGIQKEIPVVELFEQKKVIIEKIEEKKENINYSTNIAKS